VLDLVGDDLAHARQLSSHQLLEHVEGKPRQLVGGVPRQIGRQAADLPGQFATHIVVAVLG